MKSLMKNWAPMSAIVCALGLALSGCTTVGTGTSVAAESTIATKDPVAFEKAVAAMQARFSQIDAVVLDRELRESLPNVSYSLNGAPDKPASGAVVVGRVTSATPGVGFSQAVATEEAIVAFDSPEAWWSRMNLTVQVDHLVGTLPESSQSVQVAVGFVRQPGSPDPNVMLRAFVGQRVLVLLDKVPEGFVGYDPQAYMVGRGGTGLGFVADDNSISMPFIAESQVDQKNYIGGLTTVDAVIAQAQAPATTIDLVELGVRKGEPTG